MLQEQQQQLQQILGTLGDTLKTLTTRLDEQGNVTRKAFADQKLLIEGVGETVRILREKADDTNVRLSTMTQELEAMRQTIASQPQRATGDRSHRLRDPAPAGCGRRPVDPGADDAGRRSVDRAAEDLRQRLRRLHRRTVRPGGASASRRSSRRPRAPSWPTMRS